jgi:hypothetical protein
MTPNLLNVTDVVIIGDRLIVLGPDTGMTDAEYRRVGQAADDVPNEALQPTRTAEPNGQPEPAGTGPRGERQR